MSLNKRENKELIIRDIKEKFSSLFDLKFNETEFEEKFMDKFEEVFEESFYIGKEFDMWKDYNDEEELCLEEEETLLIEEYNNFEKYYQEAMKYAEHAVECCNKFYSKTKPLFFEPFVTYTFLKDKDIYQYTVNESGVIEKSFEHYIGDIYEHYNLIKNYLETHQL